MASFESDTASNVTQPRQPVRKKPRLAANSSRNGTPNAYARRSPPRRKRSASPPAENESRARSRSRSPPRTLKRPGADARIAAADRAAAEARRQREGQDQTSNDVRQPVGADLVASHYNAVPERGREWRKTDSQIKGLRSLNNWIKSTLIQKFSRPENPVEHLLVLDMACGKGGDLGKWEKAPQVPSLYVGCDIADVSIDQARQRWDETVRRSQGRHRRPVEMQAEFYVHDAFATPLADIPRVREVGFNPNAGPGNGVIQGGMMSGGFHVVSMMFALHYSFENENLARGMLKNVAGVLKKGGRFIGVMPNSAVISATVKRLLQAESTGRTPMVDEPSPKEGAEAGEVEDEEDWDPEKSSDPEPKVTNGTETNDNGGGDEDDEDDWNPELPSEPVSTSKLEAAEAGSQTNETSTTQVQTSAAEISDLPPLEWGNHLYTVRFPRQQPLTDNQPLPHDGVFRPPYGWRYHYQLEEAVDVPEYVVPWEGFRALAEDYGLELMYRKGFREVFEDESTDKELGMLAERMGVMSRDRTEGKGGLLVGEDEMEAASFYHAFCFYKT